MSYIESTHVIFLQFSVTHHLQEEYKFTVIEIVKMCKYIHDFRPLTISPKIDIEFYHSFCPPEYSPRGNRKTQIDHSGTKKKDFPFQKKWVLRCNNPELFKHFVKHGSTQFTSLLFSNTC